MNRAWIRGRGLMNNNREHIALLLIVIVLIITMAGYFIVRSKPVVYTGLKPVSIVEAPPENQLSSPVAVEVGLRGELFIVDSGNRQVVVMEEDGRYSMKFGGPGSGRAELGTPVCVAVGIDGQVYVADSGKNKVLVFSSTGDYLYSIAGEQGKGFEPLSVYCDKKGYVYVYDDAGKRFGKYDAKGKKVGEVPEEPIKGMKNASAVYLLPENKRVLAVSTSRGQYYDYYDRKVKNLGRGRLVNPSGVVYDRSRKVLFISDSYKDKIVAFGQDGSYLGEFGGTGDGFSQFRYPAGLALDELGKLYVADKGNNRIVIYSF